MLIYVEFISFFFLFWEPQLLKFSEKGKNLSVRLKHFALEVCGEME
jgi:hypothetical protein